MCTVRRVIRHLANGVAPAYASPHNGLASRICTVLHGGVERQSVHELQSPRAALRGETTGSEIPACLLDSPDSRLVRAKTPSVDPMAIKARGWCDNSYIWFAHDERFSDDEYRMKIMDGGLLLFQEKTEGGGGFGGFVIVAPHAWKFVKGPFDFTR